MKDVEEYNGFFNGRTALVTGGAGFIGSHLTQHLVNLGCEVRVLDNFSSGDSANLDGIDVSIFEDSILDTAALQHAIAGCSIVFHEAAFISVPMSMEQPQHCIEINVQGTKNVLEAASDARCGRMVFAASAACYGQSPSLPSRETDALSPASPYAESKFEGERLVASARGIDGISLRYFNVFGERQNPDSQYAAVVSAFVHAIKNNKTPIIFGDGLQTRDFTHVDNVVHANLLAASHSGELQGAVCNVGTGSAYSLLQLLQAMTDEEQPSVEFRPRRAGDVQHSCACIDAIQALLGYSVVSKTGQALRKLVNPILE